MNIKMHAVPGSVKYSITDLDEETIKLIRKSLVTNYYYNNFQGDWEENICINLSEKIRNIAA